MKHTIELLGNKVTNTSTNVIAMDSGKGSSKRLYIKVYYDGSTVIGAEFVVEDHGKVEAFTTFDGAAEHYNSLP